MELDGLFESLGNVLSALNITGGEEWYCDGCNAYLNDQPGFTRKTGTWRCTECGYINDVTDDNFFDSEEEFRRHEARAGRGVPRCPYCRGLTIGVAPDKAHWFECPDCGGRFHLEDGELVEINHRNTRGRSTPLGKCVRCGKSLDGGVYVAAQTRRDNPDGYIRCPHCDWFNEV